ncbi:hypothetical protein B0F90DRAFT_1815504 [Multifurca ochricompacta]|uniref:F-box domain-containing protein n=1 Tax=Multifurca ochricompacta TaxID=376703 RepID=A0AAD4QMY6_9AGAM|nr:hypothetical protein B0F90DRAFT_1815504 [Multifurca ochricompacta]
MFIQPFSSEPPPTASSLADARRLLDESNASLSELNRKIEVAESQLAQIVAESRCAINQLQCERAVLEDKITHALAYMSPIRRLPTELLRHIFMMNFDEYPCCAWILSSVCSQWRRLALLMPKLWSKIRLVTTPNASADTIRLWLERSGSRISLDVEIFLHVPDAPASTPVPRSRTRSSSQWPTFLSNNATTNTHYVQIQASQPTTSIQIVPPTPPIVLPHSPPHYDWPGSLSPPPPPPPLPSAITSNQSRASSHWGHIAIYYLVEQMHRWERFVFRFDRQFPSWQALKSVSGPAPLLREFEVSCAEPIYHGEWPWLPSANPNMEVVLPKLETVTLQYAPFKWSSPMLRTNLRSLNLRTVPTTGIPIDRVLHIVSNNKMLEDLSLHVAMVLNPLLPLTQTTLPDLKTLSIGGNFLMSSLVDSLITPSLCSLTLNIDARDPIDDSISNLVTRSSHPAIHSLSIAYGPNGPPFYGGLIASWGFLNDLNHLRTLQVGGTPVDPLFSVLGAPEEDVLGVMCPFLEHLALRGCPAIRTGLRSWYRWSTRVILTAHILQLQQLRLVEPQRR